MATLLRGATILEGSVSAQADPSSLKASRVDAADYSLRGRKLSMPAHVKLYLGFAMVVGRRGGGASRAQMGGQTGANGGEPLPNFSPLLPQVSARTPKIDPNKGYLVTPLKPHIYMITDGGYESAFVTTGKGVVLFAAPPSFAKHIPEAVAETTKEPIVELVYSHAHMDHIGGAGTILATYPKLTIVAEEGTAAFLRDMKDSRRPLPTETFKDHETLTVGTMRADMQVRHWHSDDGDLLINFPSDKVVIAIDALSSGAVPFMNLDLTMNMHEYLQIFDKLMSMNFDVMVPGHHSIPATKNDVRIARDYVNDVYHTMSRVLLEDHSALYQAAAAKYGKEDSFATGRVVLESEENECARDVVSRWKDKLDDVEVEAPSHCHTALVYAQWDVGVH